MSSTPFPWQTDPFI